MNQCTLAAVVPLLSTVNGIRALTLKTSTTIMNRCVTAARTVVKSVLGIFDPQRDWTLETTLSKGDAFC